MMPIDGMFRIADSPLNSGLSSSPQDSIPFYVHSIAADRDMDDAARLQAGLQCRNCNPARAAEWGALRIRSLDGAAQDVVTADEAGDERGPKASRTRCAPALPA
jgi:hypothetical protein